MERLDVSDDQALAALRAELQADFATDGVVRYAVAFPARATITLRASALHRDSERRTREVVAIEAHDAAIANPTPTLEQKIAAALTAADVTSTDLSQLFAMNT